MFQWTLEVNSIYIDYILPTFNIHRIGIDPVKLRMNFVFTDIKLLRSVAEGIELLD